MNGSNCSIFCAIRGPILLMAVGGLFWLDHTTVYGFSRTWPLLLILLGLLKLLERVSGGQPAPPGGSL
jgi:hypothetical protein